MHLLAHPIPERRVDKLMLADLRQALEARADNDRFPVLTVAADSQVLAFELRGES